MMINDTDSNVNKQGEYGADQRLCYSEICSEENDNMSEPT